ncbi:DUF2332 domain-containing protein [Actinomycetospora straminea]|uniref:DUF2332 domain-containing protein n=1 Tax=Actinomycetospora straminea TaxID=663607 RepID=A0ABP9EY03_9PSEU|nr:DUF2332 domain-containing protein [Actinomycetospora straminea]MDD7933017.1 DUF2332 domain-containing protein [Actinomycetospora straminea]
MARRRRPPDETGRATVLHPLVAEAAHRVGADAVGLVDVGCSAGFNLLLDRVAVTYSTGLVLGDPSSPVQLEATVVGERPVPDRAVPAVVARIGVDREPVDVTDPEDVAWVRAGEPDQPGRLEAAIGLTAAARPLLLRGDPIDLLPEAIERVPPDALPVVTTTWALARYSVEARLRFLQGLDVAGARRTVAWVSAEGVGVAPGVPTMGDRHASGHSILGVAVLAHRTLRADAVGRCWSRGRMLSWLVES